MEIYDFAVLVGSFPYQMKELDCMEYTFLTVSNGFQIESNPPSMEIYDFAVLAGSFPYQMKELGCMEYSK